MEYIKKPVLTLVYFVVCVPVVFSQEKEGNNINNTITSASNTKKITGVVADVFGTPLFGPM